MSVATLSVPATPLTGTASPAPATGSSAIGAAVDCLIVYRGNTPRDAMGNPISDSGRWLVTQAADDLYGVDVRGRLVRDEHRRWQVPEQGMHLSVAHCAGYSVVALTTATEIGVDLQDERDRPLAMAWLGDLLGHPAGRPATIRDFVECEALIKASHLTKETFAGVRLPIWRYGWRPAQVGYHLLSTTLGQGMQVALAARDAVPVRWWWQVRGESGPRRINDPAEVPA